jgi:hypothetical protein
VTRPARLRRLKAVAIAAVLMGFSPALAQVLSFDFMPKGGKALFTDVFGATPDTATLGEIAAPARSESDWNAFLVARSTDLDDKELRTLAAYLAVNMPIPLDKLDAAAKGGDVAVALPPDGRELAWNGCQGCHSLFASHLTQDRDLQGWQNMFNSPFHRELKMTSQERDEFSRYSAINMPMKFEDVPEDLRF